MAVPRRETIPAARSCTTGSGRIRSAARARRSCPVAFAPPVDTLTEEFPIRLTTGRRLDSFNTGVQTGGYTSPLRRGETLDLQPEDARAASGVGEGEVVRDRLAPRGGRERRCTWIDGLRPGLAFMTLHFPDEVETNILTIDAVDPKSGTAEFKAAAIRVEKLTPATVGRAGRTAIVETGTALTWTCT